MRHCFQIFTVCRPHKGLPVCWILKPSVIYVRSYGHLWYFHWSSRNFKNISLWAFRFGIQIVLGVPYNILKIWSRYDKYSWRNRHSKFRPPPPPPPHLVKGSIVRKNFNAFFGLPMTFWAIFNFYPPPCEQKDRNAENITFAILRMRAVTIPLLKPDEDSAGCLSQGLGQGQADSYLSELLRHNITWKLHI